MTEPAMTLPLPQLVVVTCGVSIDRPAGAVWDRIGAFADAGQFLDVPCKLVAGTGGLGSVRQVGEAILEVMVGEGLHCYSYVQTHGPMAPFGYHGSVAVTSDGLSASCLTYALIFDAATMDQARRDHEFDRLTGRFRRAAEAMRQVAESQP